MKIGIIGSIAKPVSTTSTGGAEVFCADIANAFVNRGHDVYLFASGDSEVDEKVHLIPSIEHSFVSIKQNFIQTFNREPNSVEKKELINSANTRTLFKAKEYENKLDLFHDNTCSLISGSVSNLYKKPIVTTMHMPVSENSDYLYYPDLITHSNNYFISVSQFQEKQFPRTYKHIYNGININNFPFIESPHTNRLVWVGRISPDTNKGLKEAITATQICNKELAFVGSISNQKYYEEEIKPLLREKYIYSSLQFNSLSEKGIFFGNAKACILPIMWEDPFPYVVLEAMATGTPIIGFARGSFPESIIDGKTGFLVNPSNNDIRGNFVIKKTGIEGICEGIRKMYSLNEIEYKQMRKNCHERIQKTFSIETMISKYLDLYTEILLKQ